ncbi:tyrosine-type recombinase/integrase [Bradyrhizobium sp. NBAIM03]|uniref:tyrosine-type recombinase/integrase n=1 Tax=Bradyrhizobium sp. NBAIM03 TaxID=2793816 RepID=UPI001CD81AFF|nr:tyrosine-type recombinase/integrase [Bradyrhizobium sp. NBAIM03]MCA1535037.1 tyrosine-type recombinase/integrase [Bradyrhizobium sp. NBAIM03]
MALRMAALTRASDGRWFARKGIPEDVRVEYQRLYGVKREAHLKLPADTPWHEAKTRKAEWEAEVETRIATLRAQRNGKGQPLTKLNAIALAGRWYNWFVAQYENDPGPAKVWRELSDLFVWEVIAPEAPDSYEEDPRSDPHWDWAKEPEVREAVRPRVAEQARVATFLASEGIALNATAYALFVDAVSDNLLPAFAVLEKRANGDYSRDENPSTFPEFKDGPARPSGVSCWELFEAFVLAVKPAPKTVSRWRSVFLEMQREFAEVGADGITEDAARRWVHGLINEERAAITVREIWLSASRRVFGWAREHKRIRQNPFKEVKVDVPRRVQTREDGRSFTAAEASIILKASLSYEKPTTPTERTRRWVPWLCAYSGARPGEITQLRGSDIEDRNGLLVMKLTPEAGTIKTSKARVVPLHEHIIAQGFMEMVKRIGKGALFYNDSSPQRVSTDPLKPSRDRADTARAHLGTWVRGLGVDDPELSPNHAWRHTFKRIADEIGMPEKMNDAITGHTQATEGRKYGAPTVVTMAAALAKFPRYKLD